MEIDKLNKCLSEMDVLWRVTPKYDDVSLEITFNCHDGGQYENVSLTIKLEDPYSFHLPFCESGEFTVEVLSPDQAKALIPAEHHESNLSALVIKVSSFDRVYYSAFSKLSWHVEGAQTLNNHELCVQI